MQQSAGEAVEAMQLSARQVEIGSNQAAEAGEALRNILEAVEGVRIQVEQIASLPIRWALHLKKWSRLWMESATWWNRMQMLLNKCPYRLLKSARAIVDIAMISQANHDAIQQADQAAR